MQPADLPTIAEPNEGTALLELKEGYLAPLLDPDDRGYLSTGMAPQDRESKTGADKPSEQIQRSVTIPNLREIHSLRKHFDSGITKSYEWRYEQLQGLHRLLVNERDAICDALKTDLGRHKTEVLMIELIGSIFRVQAAMGNLETWMQPREKYVPLELGGWPSVYGRAEMRPEPKGLVLGVVPWNYPFILMMDVLTATFSAGNCAVLKPSELGAGACERFLKEVAPKYLDPKGFQVVTGGPEVVGELLKEKWDHICFTGSPAVGKIIRAHPQVIENLTPITLELGGKSPVLIGRSALFSKGCFSWFGGNRNTPSHNNGKNFEHFSKLMRRLWRGKHTNNGQICISPDYGIVHEDCVEDLVKTWKASLEEFYGKDTFSSPSYGRIINQRNWARLKGYINEIETRQEQQGVSQASSEGGTKQIKLYRFAPEGGTTESEKERFICPTLILNPPLDSEVMTQELFGPIFPVVTYRTETGDHENASELAQTVSAMQSVISKVCPEPLASYVFSAHEPEIKALSLCHKSGCVTSNEVIYHYATGVPLGGCGQSGIGSLNGEAGFLELSNQRGHFRTERWGIDIPFLFPPWERWGPRAEKGNGLNLFLFKMLHRWRVWLMCVGSSRKPWGSPGGRAKLFGIILIAAAAVAVVHFKKLNYPWQPL